MPRWPQKNCRFSIYSIFLILVISYTVALIPFSTGIHAAPAQRTGAVKGVVYCCEHERPLKGANVYIPDLAVGTVTNNDGSFVLANIPEGTYRVGFSYVGYKQQLLEITVRAGESAEVDIALQISPFESEALTVTGTPRATDPMESAQDVSAVSGKTLRRMQTGSLGQTLEELPGIHSINTGPVAGKPVIRGLSHNRIRILNEGVSSDFQQYGVRHMPNEDPLNAERIEIVRGPASILYGSDALGGVVNIFPHSIPAAVNGSPVFGGSVTSQYYSNNEEAAGQLSLQGASNGFGFHGALTRRSAENFHSPDATTYGESGKEGDPKFSGEIPHTDFDQLTGTFGIGYRGTFGRIRAHYDHWGNENNFLLPAGLPIGLNLENDVFRLDANVIAGSWLIKPVFNYQQNLRQANQEGMGRNSGSDAIAVDILRKIYTGRLDLQHNPIGVFSGTIGAEIAYHNQDARGKVPLTATANIWNGAAYVFEEAKLDRWTLFMGARIDRRTIDAEPDDRIRLPNPAEGESDDVLTQEYTAATGSFGASYRATDAVTLAGNIGRGFRTPDVFELHAYGVHGGVAAFQVGNPNLDPESSFNTDLSLRWRTARFEGSATVYHNRIDNYIFLMNNPDADIPEAPPPPVYTISQTDAALTGFETGVKLSPLSWLQLEGTYSTVDGDNKQSDEKLPLMPPARLGGSLSVSGRSIGQLMHPYFRVTARHTWDKDAAGRYEPFSQFDFSIPFGVASTDAYTLFDVEAGFDIGYGGQTVNFSMGIKNIANKAYRDFLDTYKGYAMSPGRNIYFKATVPFSLI